MLSSVAVDGGLLWHLCVFAVLHTILHSYLPSLLRTVCLPLFYWLSNFCAHPISHAGPVSGRPWRHPVAHLRDGPAMSGISSAISTACGGRRLCRATRNVCFVPFVSVQCLPLALSLSRRPFHLLCCRRVSIFFLSLSLSFSLCLFLSRSVPCFFGTSSVHGRRPYMELISICRDCITFRTSHVHIDVLLHGIHLTMITRRRAMLFFGRHCSCCTTLHCVSDSAWSSLVCNCRLLGANCTCDVPSRLVVFSLGDEGVVTSPLLSCSVVCDHPAHD